MRAGTMTRVFVRKGRYPAWLCWIAALVVFMPTLVLAWSLSVLLLAAQAGQTHDPVLVVFIVIVASIVGTVTAWFVAKATFKGLRWRRVEYDGTECLHCGYNLTGNVSGTCPECGEAV
jgi:membrane protein YqaA with SNARE-associated domain